MHHSRVGRRTALLVTALCALLATHALADDAPPKVATAKGPPTQVIDRFHAVLLDVMKNAKTLGFEGRRDKLAPALDATYDFPGMAQRSLATSWGKLDDAQHERFISVFRAMTLRTYATRFDGYDNERFETLGEEPSVAGTVIVRTVLHATDEDVHLDYRLRSMPAGFKVIDVYLSGTVSELALRRAEYTSVFERDGFDALVDALERKVADAPGSPPPRKPESPNSDSRNSDSRLR
ncbi:MAG TPA: ABC transporter substrate-binding protein [Myxococcota bacterium]|nr:ABC transporter substrate-binding protein [Myxococcota bacterium]